jgi:hypothetical protein
MSYIKKIAKDAGDLLARHTDNNGGLYARQLVVATLEELFRYEYRRTPWASGELISISNAMNEGAREVSWFALGDVGSAGLVADNATDIPVADIQGDMSINKVATIATAVQFSTQDIRSAAMQGLFDISVEKARAAREAHDRKLDELIRFGDSPLGLAGVCNAPGSFVVTATNGNWASSATAAQIVSDFTQAYSAIFDGTDGVEEPDTAVLPSAVWTRLSTLQNSVASDITVLEYLKRAFPSITLWRQDAGLNAAGAGSTPAMMLYSREQDRLRALMPMVLRPLPLEQHGLVFKMVFESRFGGIATPRPKSIARLDNIQ